nr:hypothetical protein [Zoogloea sp. LCSB751]
MSVLARRVRRDDPLLTVEVEPEPMQSSTFTPVRRTPGAMPTT